MRPAPTYRIGHSPLRADISRLCLITHFRSLRVGVRLQIQHDRQDHSIASRCLLFPAWRSRLTAVCSRHHRMLALCLRYYSPTLQGAGFDTSFRLIGPADGLNRPTPTMRTITWPLLLWRFHQRRPCNVDAGLSPAWGLSPSAELLHGRSLAPVRAWIRSRLPPDT